MTPRGKAARKAWLATQRSGTLRIVSSFYESATKKLVGGIKPKDKQDGDVVLRDYSASIEVKPGTATNGFAIRWPQLQELRRRMDGFPFLGAPCYYFLWSYQARESRKVALNRLNRRSLIRFNVLQGTGFEFLAERTRTLWIVPLSLIDARYGSEMDSDGQYLPYLFPQIEGREDLWGIRLRFKDLRALGASHEVLCGKGSVTHRPLPINGSYRTTFAVSFINDGVTPCPPLKGIQWHP